jgi:hypothetical protein
VVTAEEQEALREALPQIEQTAGTGYRKWHKSQSSRRLRYLSLVLDETIAAGEVFYGSYPKPLPYFPVHRGS